MKTVADETYNLIIADIPYYGIIEDEWDNQWKTLNEYVSWLDLLFSEFSRILVKDSACYVYSSITNYPYVQLTLNKYLTYFSTITWKKQRGRGKGWGFNREEICVNAKGNPIFKKVESKTLMLPHLRSGSIDYSNGRSNVRGKDYKWANSIWDDIPQVCSYRKQLHPTEKPIEMGKRIIEASSNRGDLIFIPFGGSGSECLAAKSLRRNFDCCEINPEYYNLIQDRFGIKR